MKTDHQLAFLEIKFTLEDQKMKVVAYIDFVRLVTEYCSPASDPHQKKYGCETCGKICTWPIQ